MGSSAGRRLALLAALGGAAVLGGAGCTVVVPLPADVTGNGDDAAPPAPPPSLDAGEPLPDASPVADAGDEVGPSTQKDGGGDNACGKVWVRQAANLQRPQVIIAFDRSLSMLSKMFGNKRRRDAIRDELMPVLRDLQAGVEFGYVEFPARSPCNPATSCCASKVILQPSSDNAFEIQKQLTCAAGATACFESPQERPVAAALATIRDFYAPTFDPDKASFVMIITDGAPTGCTPGDPMACDASAEATNLFNLTHARTIVLAVGDETKSNACLDSLAMAGQLPRAGMTPPYAWSPDATQLGKQIDEAMMAVKDETCRLTLAVSPGSTDHMDVTVNGHSLDRDPMRKDGWNFDPGGSTDIRLYGSACTRLQAGFTTESQVKVWQLCARCNGKVICP